MIRTKFEFNNSVIAFDHEGDILYGALRAFSVYFNTGVQSVRWSHTNSNALIVAFPDQTVIVAYHKSTRRLKSR